MALADLVREADGRVATGFLGTPLVLPALAAAGRFDAAYLMLLRREVPSWLYQVAAGATTVWERWDAIRPGRLDPRRADAALPGGRGRSRTATCCRSTTTPTGRSSTGSTGMSPGSRPRPRATARSASRRVPSRAGPRRGERRHAVRARGDRWVVGRKVCVSTWTSPSARAPCSTSRSAPTRSSPARASPSRRPCSMRAEHELLVTNPRIVPRGEAAAPSADTAQPARPAREVPSKRGDAGVEGQRHHPQPGVIVSSDAVTAGACRPSGDGRRRAEARLGPDVGWREGG